MKTKSLKGKLLSEIPKKKRDFLPDDTLIECVISHTFAFNSGLSIRTFNWEKGQSDRLGWTIIDNPKYWKIKEEGKNEFRNEY